MLVELTCPCGRRLRVSDAFAGKQGQCPACGRQLRIPEGEAPLTGVAAPSAEAARAVVAAPGSAGPKGPAAPGDAVTPPAGLVADPHDVGREDPGEGDGAKLTGVGCVVTLLTVAIILGVALPIVRWRDPATGQPLPRMVAVIAPFLVGASFHGICAALLRLVGLRLWSKPGKDGPASP
jgi:hypothetical protein